jgi:murein DD-endopeptidase MepM/ murein hydrolase activator NlpD
LKLGLVILLLLPIMAYAASPVPVGYLSSSPGWRPDPFGSGKIEYHRGYDIACPSGTPVRPMQSGTICYTGPRKGYGNLVAVDHGNGYVTLYGHLSRILARLGTKVDTDTVIALSGNTGRSTGPHLHLEYRIWPGATLVHKEQQPPGEVQGDAQESWVDGHLLSETSNQGEEKLLKGGWNTGM